MTKPLVAIAVMMLIAVPGRAASRTGVTGDYVEARTAEVFTGGCTMNSEAETVGREAVLAWRVNQGRYHGVDLDGLAVVAALAGDHNLGMREMGGASPVTVRALLYVDSRATPTQQQALAALVQDATNGLPTTITEIKAVPVRFERHDDVLEVAAGDASLVVQTKVKHDPSCGAMQWFNPLGDMDKATLGFAKSHVYWGTALGTKWRQVDKKSAFWGTFSLDDRANTSPTQP